MKLNIVRPPSETESRSINWFQDACDSVASHLPQVGPSSRYLTQRLTSLLFERLPDPLCQALLALLPGEVAGSDEFESVLRSANQAEDRSIGYINFVERSETALGVSLGESEWFERDVGTEAAQVFLWTVFREIPPELKSRLIDVLPEDLRSRMNLYTDTASNAKVA